MQVLQSIQHPLGITVFGSAVIRASPNVATLRFSVHHKAEHPRAAFRLTREGVQSVRTYLAQAGVREVSTSHISLAEAFRYVNGENRFDGYRATVDFNLVLNELDRIEEIIAGLVDAGVNRITNIMYDTTALKSLRAEARRQAVRAAQEKAQVYCDEAGITLGRILHLEDVNPELLRGEREGHTVSQVIVDEEASMKAFDPGSIVVTGAVMITFAIQEFPSV